LTRWHGVMGAFCCRARHRFSRLVCCFRHRLTWGFYSSLGSVAIPPSRRAGWQGCHRRLFIMFCNVMSSGFMGCTVGFATLRNRGELVCPLGFASSCAKVKEVIPVNIRAAATIIGAFHCSFFSSLGPDTCRAVKEL
jgi:hypothetical protein